MEFHLVPLCQLQIEIDANESFLFFICLLPSPMPGAYAARQPPWDFLRKAPYPKFQHWADLTWPPAFAIAYLYMNSRSSNYSFSAPEIHFPRIISLVSKGQKSKEPQNNSWPRMCAQRIVGCKHLGKIDPPVKLRSDLGPISCDPCTKIGRTSRSLCFRRPCFRSNLKEKKRKQKEEKESETLLILFQWYVSFGPVSSVLSLLSYLFCPVFPCLICPTFPVFFFLLFFFVLYFFFICLCTCLICNYWHDGFGEPLGGVALEPPGFLKFPLHHIGLNVRVENRNMAPALSH